MAGYMNSAGLLELLAGQEKISKEAFVALSAEFASAEVEALERALLERKLVTEEDIARAKAEALGMAYVDLLGMELNPEALNIIPKSVAETYQAVAYDLDGTTLKVAYVDPLNAAAVEAFGFLLAERNLTAA